MESFLENVDNLLKALGSEDLALYTLIYDTTQALYAALSKNEDIQAAKKAIEKDLINLNDILHYFKIWVDKENDVAIAALIVALENTKYIDDFYEALSEYPKFPFSVRIVKLIKER